MKTEYLQKTLINSAIGYRKSKKILTDNDIDKLELVDEILSEYISYVFLYHGIQEKLSPLKMKCLKVQE